MNFWRKQKKPSRTEFEQFYRQAVRPLASHLRQIGLTNPTDLEEVLQEAFLEAHRSWHTLEDPQKATAWMFTIGRRQFFRWLSRHKKEWRGRVDEEHEAGMTEDIPGTLGQRRLVTSIMRLLGEIENPKKQEAIRLFYLEEWPLNDIAVQIDTKVSTITTWLNRFRELVKHTFGDEWQERRPENMLPLRRPT